MTAKHEFLTVSRAANEDVSRVLVGSHGDHKSGATATSAQQKQQNGGAND